MPDGIHQPPGQGPVAVHLRLVPSNGSQLETSRKPRRVAPKQTQLRELEEISNAAENLHDVLRHLHQAVIDGDAVVVRALARSAERKAAKIVARTKLLGDLGAGTTRGAGGQEANS